MIHFAPHIALMVCVAAWLLYLAHVKGRVAAVYAGLALIVVGGALDTLGAPKPIWAEIRQTDGLRVIGLHYAPGTAIYVWADGDPPRAYSLPWSEEAARKAQVAEREGIPLALFYEDQEPVLHPMPQPPDPSKAAE